MDAAAKVFDEGTPGTAAASRPGSESVSSIAGLAGAPAARAAMLLPALAFVAVNLVFKWRAVGRQGIWLDEAVTLRLAPHAFNLPYLFARDSTPPLHYWLLWPWVALFGDTEWVIRGFSVACSALTAGGLVWVGGRFFDRTTGIVAALLFSASNLQFHYATEARCYALVGLSSLAALALYLRLFEKPTWPGVLGLGAMNAGLFLTHYVTIWLVVAQVVGAPFLAGSDRRRISRLVLSLCVTGLLIAPWAAFVVRHWPPSTPTWLAPPVQADLLWVFRLFVGDSGAWAVHYALLAVLVAVSFIRGAGGGSAADPGTPGAAGRLVLLVLLAVLPPVLAFVASRAMPMFLPRYVLYASLGVDLLFGFAISRATHSTPLRVALAALVVLPGLPLVKIDPLPREDWNRAVALARAEQAKGESVIVVPRPDALTFAYHDDRAGFAVYEYEESANERWRERGVFFVDSLAELEAFDLGDVRRLVVVLHENVPGSGRGWSRDPGRVRTLSTVRGLRLAIVERTDEDRRGGAAPGRAKPTGDRPPPDASRSDS